jgi:hypothetical protein
MKEKGIPTVDLSKFVDGTPEEKKEFVKALENKEIDKL